MKKSILVSVAFITTLGLVAMNFLSRPIDNHVGCQAAPQTVLATTHFVPFPFSSNTEINLGLNVNSRYVASITKDEIYNAQTIVDLVPAASNWANYSFEDVTITAIIGTEEVKIKGEGSDITHSQRSLLQSLSFADEFYINAKGRKSDFSPGRMDDLAYYVSISPEKHAKYSGGELALIDFLEQHSKTQTEGILQSSLKSGRIKFTVDTEGAIQNVFLDSSSGYDHLDNSLIELINNLPGTWHPAQNADGESVNEQLVLFYGAQGC